MRLEIIDRFIEPEDILSGKGLTFKERKSLFAFTEAKKKSFLKGPEPDDRGDCQPKKFGLKDALKSEKAEFVYLDTETTGTAYRHKFVEISILDDKGEVLKDTLVTLNIRSQEGY